MSDARRPYAKPEIARLASGTMNKFGASPYYSRRVRAEIDGQSIESLAQRFGSPLFVFSEARVRQAARQVREAFAHRYPNVAFGWSYKTNYLDAIAAIFHQEGSFAEVVSAMEYDKARRLGVPGERILFNGPRKTREALKRAAQEGARIHIDHLDEVDDLEGVAAELGREIPAAIRLNLDAGIQPQWSRFGFNLESGQAESAIRRIGMGGRIRLNGLHCHLGTFITEPEAYRIQAEKLARFAAKLQQEQGLVIDYLDLGGGFPSRSRLKGVALPPDLSVPPVEQYAEALCEGLFAGLPPNHAPQLILETGRGLIDEAGFLIATVCAAKRLPDGVKSYVLDAGVNLLYTSAWFKYNVELAEAVQGVGEPSLLNGPLCMNIDVVDEGVWLPPLKRGARLVLSPVGAYNVTQWMQFIELRPAVVLIGLDGTPEVIREAETLADLTNRERLPARLALGADV